MSVATQDVRGGAVEETGSAGYVWLVASVAALGGLLFGYDTAVISGAIGYLTRHFGVEESAVSTGWAASSALVGCMIGAAFAGTLSDWLGRKKIMLVAAVLFLVSAIGAAFPQTLNQFVLARLLGGVGIGAASILSPLYIAEVSPARSRGRLVSVNQFAIISGMLVVYFVNAWLARHGAAAGGDWNVSHGWRWMFGSGAFPALLFLVLLFFVPESPRWLVKRGRNAEALGILSRVGGAEHAHTEMQEISQTVADEHSSLGLLLRPGTRTVLLIGIVLAVLQQVTGINIVLYFAPKIFEAAGLNTVHAIGDTVFVGAVNLLFTVVAIWLVDRLGRKPLLMAASAGMGISLTLLGGAFVTGRAQGVWVLVFVLAYVASFAVAMGPVVWVVLSEIFPTRVRGTAMAVATVCLWAACFLVTQFFPWMLDHLEGYTFFVYAAMCAAAFVFTAVAIPETRGKSLEEIERRWGRQ